VATLRVATSITQLVSMEVIEGLVSTVPMWTNIAVVWIQTVIVFDVTVEVVRPVEPRASSAEPAAAEPLGPKVPVWRAVVRDHIVVTIRADRFCSDIDGT
jgi:hypothetical protein